MDALSAEGSMPPDLPAATWFEQVPASYRRLRAGIAAVIAAALGGWLAWVQVQNGIFGQAESLWILVIIAVGAWRWRHWMALREVRRFATVTVALGAKERMRKAVAFWLLGFGGVAVIWPMQFHFDQLEEHWLAGVPFLVLGLVGTFIFMYARTEKRLTPEAAKLKAHFEAQDAQAGQASSPEVDAISAKAGALIDLPLVRYPISALVLWFAYYVSQEWTDRRSWIVVLAAVCWSLWLARELFGWVLGLAVVGGIAWAFFAGVAALPVSAAIVIGALIIASAMRK
jgi:hypothetical protein